MFKEINPLVCVAGLIISYVSSIPMLLLIVYVILIGVDILSGIIVAKLQKTFTSSTMREGILKKVLMILLVGGLSLMQISFKSYGINVPAMEVILSSLIVMECKSLLENASRFNNDIPQSIKEFLNKFK